MSYLDKLGIQGIRSFGPEDLRKIEFYSPLTLILGQNGCGKTTIIESLKYITTGEVPPGCGKGAAFVHDPKIAKETYVRGQIKLRFNNVKGESITASKVVEVVQKPKKTEFSLLESTFSYEGPDGTKKSVSNKCIDFNMEMTSLLGVSKPILENVIFCHQEESNWPLDEGKKVKDKFDAIFNATKYIKCLESIRKHRKEKKLGLSTMKETLEALKNSKEQADRMRKELEKVKKDCSKLKEEQDKLTTDQQPIKQKIKELSEKEERISTINGDIRGKEHRLCSFQDLKREIKSRLTEDFKCNDTELLNLILDFDQEMRVKNSKHKQVEIVLLKLSGEIESLKKNESKAMIVMGNLEAEQKAHLDNIKRRDLLLQKLTLKYNICGYESHDEFSTLESSDILSHLGEFLQKEKKTVLEKKKDFDEKEGSTQKSVDALRFEETTLEHDISTLSNRMEENSRKSRYLKQKLLANEEELSSIRIEDMQNSIDKIQESIQKEQERVNISELYKDIERKKVERENLERKLEEVKKKVAKMNRLAQARSQYDIYIKEKNSLEQKNTFLKRKNADDFQCVFKGPIGDNVRNELEAQISNIRRQINNFRDQKSILDKNKTELGMKVDNEKHEISRFNEEIKVFETKLEELCSGNDLESAINKLKDQIELLNKRKGDHESSKVMFCGFMEKIRGGEGCPLCHRDFDEGYQKELLVEEIEGKLSRLPHELMQIKKDLQAKESLRERLLQLRPQKESSDKGLKELERRKSKLKIYYNDIEKVTNELEECDSQLSFLISDEEICNRIQSDIVALDGNMKNIRQLKDKISNIQATLGTSDDELSMDNLMKHQNDLDLKVKNLRREIESIQETIMDHNKHLQILNDKKIQLSTRLLELKTKQQETEKIKEEIDKFKDEKVKMEEKIETNRSAVAPIKLQLKEKLEEKKKISQEKEKFLELENRKLEVIRDETRNISEIHNHIRRYIEEGCENALAEGQKKVETFQREMRKKDEEKNQLQEESNHILREITTQKERKRNMEDEKTIREKAKEILELEQHIENLKEQVKNFNYDNIFEEKKKLLRDQVKNMQNIASIDGRILELNEKKKAYEANLNSKSLINAAKNYKSKFVEMKCIDIACNDLNKYYKALETAIMKFHREKMDNINNIIRELWRTTYRGNDIDYVEIKTDENESQGADKRRTYNYRVVMVKNDVEMDMRGRCSAGQKVLSSLIIRMALAETFSANCGILALDEPTTNLDRENIDALSLALLNIVNNRSNQKNFQLIVITHDNEFLERMMRADFIQYYYEVSRDERGLSRIARKGSVE